MSDITCPFCMELNCQGLTLKNRPKKLSNYFTTDWKDATNWGLFSFREETTFKLAGWKKQWQNEIFRKHSISFVFAKKHIQNLTFESVALSIQVMKKVRYPSSLIKKCFVLFSQVNCLQLLEFFEQLLHNLGWLATSLGTSKKL